VVLRGTGREMIPVPEMEAFGERFGFRFVAHQIGNANRSARVEIKTLKNAHNTAFLRLARPGSVCRVVAFWGANQGRAVPALRLSLPNNPLVNSVCSAPSAL
jgi:hypothetical protein